MKTSVLFVDDEPRVLQGLKRVLWEAQCGWDIATAGGVDEALAKLRETDFGAVVSDINMPGRDGFALLTDIQSDERTKDVPVIILTGRDDTDLKRRALELGAVDLLNKPVHPQDLLARLRNALRLKSYQDQLRNQNAILEQKVAERTAELTDSRLDIIWRLGKAGEHRDEQTGNHVVRVGCYSRALGQALGLERELVETLFLASPLHDIGKIGIPDSVLLKRGRLDEAEWVVMRTHCAIGAQILREDSKTMRAYLSTYDDRQAAAGKWCRNPVLKLAAVIALTHHAWWDGSGYPHKIAGKRIPLAARIVSLADSYDALRSERPYKPAFTEQEALHIIRGECGRHFDPEICAALERIAADFNAIHHALLDPPHQSAATDPRRPRVGAENSVGRDERLEPSRV